MCGSRAALRQPRKRRASTADYLPPYLKNLYREGHETSHLSRFARSAFMIVSVASVQTLRQVWKGREASHGDG